MKGPYRVQRLEPETTLAEVKLSGGRTAAIKSPHSVTYAVVDADGVVVKKKITVWDHDKHKERTITAFEVYPRKSGAQATADFMNKSDAG